MPTTNSDQQALTLAIVQSGISEEDFERKQIIGGCGWGHVARQCAYNCQIDNLRLKPWETPPCYTDRDEPGPAGNLLREMLRHRISRWHPDPMKALEDAKRRRNRSR